MFEGMHEEPGVLQSMGSQRVRHDLATEQQCEYIDGDQERDCCNLMDGNSNVTSAWYLLCDLG